MIVDPLHMLCRGHGRCVKTCPEVFELDESTGCVEVKIASPPSELHDKVRRAVYACPSKALLTTHG